MRLMNSVQKQIAEQTFSFEESLKGRASILKYLVFWTGLAEQTILSSLESFTHTWRKRSVAGCVLSFVLGQRLRRHSTMTCIESMQTGETLTQ